VAGPEISPKVASPKISPKVAGPEISPKVAGPEISPLVASNVSHKKKSIVHILIAHKSNRRKDSIKNSTKKHLSGT
jgi:hypothetical protein